MGEAGDFVAWDGLGGGAVPGQAAAAPGAGWVRLRIAGAELGGLRQRGQMQRAGWAAVVGREMPLAVRSVAASAHFEMSIDG